MKDWGNKYLSFTTPTKEGVKPYWYLRFPLPDGSIFHSTLTVNEGRDSDEVLRVLKLSRDALVEMHYPGATGPNPRRRVLKREPKSNASKHGLGIHFRDRVQFPKPGQTKHNSFELSFHHADGRHQRKAWSCHKYGHEGALKLAKEQRAEWEAVKEAELKKRGRR